MATSFDDTPGQSEMYSPEGVDLTLIRWMLSLTPLERLEHVQGQIDAIRRLKGEDGADPA